MSEKKLPPLGVAVHTRGVKRGEDYGWYVRVGDTELFEQMKEIYNLLLRDVGGEMPQLAVLLKQDRVGFLIANMPSQRLDHAPRIINDTLYLEFDQEYDYILKAVASLLVASSDEYKESEQYFTNYAELIYQNFLQNTSLYDEKFGEIEWLCYNKNLKPIKPSSLALALPYDDKSRKLVSAYLVDVAIRSVNSFCLVATGRVNLDKCHQLALMTEECIIITQSSDIEIEIDLKKIELNKLQQINQ